MIGRTRLLWGIEMILLAGGRLLQAGAPLDILTRPESLAVASVVGVETVIPGRRVRRERGIAELEVAGVRLWAADTDLPDDEVYVCIRAENVTLEIGSGTRSSARNHLPGTVLAVTAAGPLVRVTVDVGFQDPGSCFQASARRTWNSISAARSPSASKRPRFIWCRGEP